MLVKMIMPHLDDVKQNLRLVINSNRRNEVGNNEMEQFERNAVLFSALTVSVLSPL
jgi:hypothetical protein